MESVFNCVKKKRRSSYLQDKLSIFFSSLIMLVRFLEPKIHNLSHFYYLFLLSYWLCIHNASNKVLLKHSFFISNYQRGLPFICFGGFHDMSHIDLEVFYLISNFLQLSLNATQCGFSFVFCFLCSRNAHKESWRKYVSI